MSIFLQDFNLVISFKIMVVKDNRFYYVTNIPFSNIHLAFIFAKIWHNCANFEALEYFHILYEHNSIVDVKVNSVKKGRVLVINNQ